MKSIIVMILGHFPIYIRMRQKGFDNDYEIVKVFTITILNSTQSPKSMKLIVNPP